jgi:hypothetical protein
MKDLWAGLDKKHVLQVGNGFLVVDEDPKKPIRITKFEFSDLHLCFYG